MESYKQCVHCKLEFEPKELFTLYQNGFFVELCKKCLASITKDTMRKILESDDEFLKRKLQSNRYLYCPVCHSSKVENDFIVMIVEDPSSPMGVDGFAVCRSCFKEKFEKPEITEESLKKITTVRKVETAELSTTSHMNHMVAYNKIMEELEPKIHTDRFECSVCSQVFLPRDMPYVVAYIMEEEDENGVVVVSETSSKVCLECYRKLWQVTAGRGMRGDVYSIVQAALVRLTTS